MNFNVRFLDDHQWHQICCTWNGVTGQSLVYVDGVRDANVGIHKYPPNREEILRYPLPGGGNLALFPEVGQIFHVSEVNLWNRVLYAEEIAKSSQSCVGSTGNVKNWFDFLPGFDSANSTTTSPSQCRSPSSIPEDQMAGNLDSSTVQSVGKKKDILKFKQHTSKKKNTNLKV